MLPNNLFLSDFVMILFIFLNILTVFLILLHFASFLHEK